MRKRAYARVLCLSTSTAALLAHIAECDAWRLYLPAAYPSMFAYCVHELRLSEDAACNRIQAARLARQFPAIFEAVADGRLHLSAVRLLGAFLTPENAERTCWLLLRAGPGPSSRSCSRGASRSQTRWGWCRPCQRHHDRRTSYPPRGG